MLLGTIMSEENTGYFLADPLLLGQALRLTSEIGFGEVIDLLLADLESCNVIAQFAHTAWRSRNKDVLKIRPKSKHILEMGKGTGMQLSNRMASSSRQGSWYWKQSRNKEMLRNVLRL